VNTAIRLTCLCAVVLLSACSSLREAGDHAVRSAFPNPRTYGYTSYDPCIRCGEEWVFLNLDETKELTDVHPK
jgi:hypothetical protein